MLKKSLAENKLISQQPGLLASKAQPSQVILYEYFKSIFDITFGWFTITDIIYCL